MNASSAAAALRRRRRYTTGKALPCRAFLLARWRNSSYRSVVRHLAWASAWIALAALGACSGDEPDERVKVAENSADPGFQVDDSTLSENGRAADAPACQTDVRAAESIDLDMFVMLDSSGSMAQPLSALARMQVSRWDAVRASLTAFVEAPETEGIGVGLQFFPQLVAGAPDICASVDACGAAGPCSASLCVAQYGANTRQGPIAFFGPADPGCQGEDCLCSSDSDCGGNGASCQMTLGVCTLAGQGNPTNPPSVCNVDEDCAGLPGTTCELIGFCDSPNPDAAVACVGSIGCADGSNCVRAEPVCLNKTRCEAAVYAQPAVPITSGTTRAAQIRSALDSRAPDGLTPTGPALQGALDHARRWAEQHPDRQVVTVLATDGLPEGRCSPAGIDDIAGIASAANRGAQPIRTFVIGVFSSAELGQARLNLDAIARAGGSESAVLLSSGGNVTEEFLQALNRIRDTTVSCEFKLTGSGLDFEKVNLEVADAAGKTLLVNVGEAGACGDDQGWFYERDGAGTPTQIRVCPSTCRRFVTGGVSANLQIGCATLIR
jgi:hypothetical protein